jgi:osmotically inducible protein OsmC
MNRSASAVWKGDLKSGKGALTSDSGVLSDTQYGHL